MTNPVVRILLVAFVLMLGATTWGCLPANNCSLTATCPPDETDGSTADVSVDVRTNIDVSLGGQDAMQRTDVSISADVADSGAASCLDDATDAGQSCQAGGAAIDGGVIGSMPEAGTPPSLSIDPATKDFSSIAIGLFAEATFQVSNTGGQPTSLPLLDVDGTDAGLFFISANTCTAAIAAGDSCFVSIKFSPTTVGPKSARLTVTATLGGATTASLQGVGVTPGALTVSPSNRSLGSVLQGAQGDPSTFTVTNSGATPTGMLATSIGGSLDFAITTDDCASRSLLPMASCTVSVTLKPTSSGQKSGTLIVSATPGGTASSSLTGVSLSPATLSVSPATLTYPATTLGATSATQNLVVINRGGVAAGTTTALAVVVGGSNPQDFTITANTCMGTLAPGANCTVTVAFKPLATDDRTASLLVSATPGGSPSASLTGEGVSPASLSLGAASGSSSDFGAVVAATTVAETFVVSNSGQQPSSRITVAVSGAGFAVITPAAGDCVSGTTTLSPGGSCTVHVSLTPSTPGTASGTLTVSASTGGSVMLQLKGTAVAAGSVTIAPTAQSFPSLLPGAVGTPVTFTVTNTGGATTGMLVASITRSTEFAIVTDGCNGRVLAAAATCTITVQFSPASTGQKTGSLSISTAPGGTASSALSGSALSPASISITPSALTFADTVVGATSAAQSLTVTNNGDVAAGTTTPLTAALGGTNAAEFTVTSNTCMPTLAARATCTVAVAFRPAAAGPGKRGTLTVSAAPGGAPSVALTGSALAPAALQFAAASGSSVDFGARVTGSNQTETFVVSNSGQQTSSALTVGLTGTDFALIAPAGTDCISSPSGSATTLAPAASCTLRVRFTPTAVAARTATLTVTASVGGSRTLALRGSGLAPSSLSGSPLSQNFGSVLVGGRSPPTSFTVTNVGGVATGALSTSLSGAEFAITTDTCRGQTLGAGAACSVTVTFSPSSTSSTPKTGSLTISGTPGGTSSIALSGIGASLTIDPTAFSFPNTAAGSTSAPRSFTVTNPATGSAGTTTSLSVTKGGTNPADFSVDSSTCTGTLGSGSSCTIVVTFRPMSAAMRSANIAVSATPGGTVTATLTGTGETVATLTVAAASGSSANFGSVPVGMSKDQTFVLSNTGQQGATGITIGVTAGSDFRRLVGSVGDCGPTLGGGTSCNIRAHFEPTATGTRTATITVNATTGTVPSPFALSGAGACSTVSCPGGCCTGTGQCGTSWYPDNDNDTFGDRNATPTCSVGPPTALSVTDHADCCDGDPNTKPTQTGWFVHPDLCGSYDFNCSGRAESQPHEQLGLPPYCGDMLQVCTPNFNTNKCDLTCTTSNPEGNPACVGACFMSLLSSCGSIIGVATGACAGFPFGQSFECQVEGPVSNGTDQLQACH